jgi:DNA polymerase/3'-5' exonuclease PolX
MDIPGMGPKTLSMLHKEKGISNLSQLEKALEDGSLMDLFGIGEKKIENIKRGIQLFKQSKGRMNLGAAFPVAKRIVETLRQKTGSKKIEWAGSLRRMKENIGDIDILALWKEEHRLTFVWLKKIPMVRLFNILLGLRGTTFISEVSLRPKESRSMNTEFSKERRRSEGKKRRMFIVLWGWIG